MTMIMSITCNLYANLHQLVSEAIPMHESSLIFPNPYQSIHVSQANRPIYISDPHPWQHLQCRAPYPTKYPRAVQCHDCLGGPLKTYRFFQTSYSTQDPVMGIYWGHDSYRKYAINTSHISSHIITYHHISSHIITYHHISSHIITYPHESPQPTGNDELPRTIPILVLSH